MKLKPLIAISILCVCALFSCKKNSSNNSTNNPNKLKLYIEDLSQTPANEIDTFTVTYDADNRITALTGSKVRTVYTYSSNSSFTLDLYDMNVLSIHEILFLNNQSYIDSTFQYNNTNDTTTEKYTYTGSLLTDLTTYDYTTSGGAQFDTEDEYQYDNNGNVTKDTQTDQYGNVTVTTAVYGSQLLNFSINPSYYPLHSKNIPINETVTDGFGNTEAGISYAYAFDGNGRITKQSAFDSISGYTLSKIFVYY
jgi:hypothetical protein